MRLTERLEKLETLTGDSVVYVWQEHGETHAAALARWRLSNTGRAEAAKRVVYIKWMGEGPGAIP